MSSDQMKSVAILLFLWSAVGSGQTPPLPMSAVAHGAENAPMTFEQCSAATLNRDSDVYVNSLNTVRIARIERQDEADDICISLANCNWRLLQVARSIS